MRVPSARTIAPAPFSTKMILTKSWRVVSMRQSSAWWLSNTSTPQAGNWCSMGVRVVCVGGVRVAMRGIVSRNTADRVPTCPMHRKCRWGRGVRSRESGRRPSFRRAAGRKQGGAGARPATCCSLWPERPGRPRSLPLRPLPRGATAATDSATMLLFWTGARVVRRGNTTRGVRDAQRQSGRTPVAYGPLGLVPRLVRAEPLRGCACLARANERPRAQPARDRSRRCCSRITNSSTRPWTQGKWAVEFWSNARP